MTPQKKSKNRNQLTQVDLFSGVGGMLLAGANAGFALTMGCEIEPYSRSILHRNFPHLEIAEDVHDVCSEKEAQRRYAKQGRSSFWTPETPTILTGGFPFQTNYSRGESRRNDPRSLWDQFARVAGELRPTWVLVETVPRLASLGLDDAIWDLERAGYRCTAINLPAQAVDCPLRKDRLYIVGAQGHGPGLHDFTEPAGFRWSPGEWPVPGPELHRVAERFPGGLDWHLAGLHALGDATVPRAAEVILRGIAETERAFVAARKA